MQAVFALVLCAVLNNQIQWDRCTFAPGSYGYFGASEECWVARTKWAETFAQYPASKSSHHEFIQFKDRNSGPFNSTVTCVQKDVPAFRPAP